ncbi:hypothetical protein BJV78DRAFT_1158345 [Lactifluus subvellereus]|nr:hypothetical protein BJV78DRAFT_1158345 [Lactifluus subvellereus]
MSCPKLTIMEPRRGSSKVILSPNGKRLVPFYGFTENVCAPHPYSLTEPDDLDFEAGSGKSVLCSTIVEDIDSMRKAGLASLAFFYFDFGDDKKKDRRALLSSFIFQLHEQSDSYFKILSDFYSAHRRRSQLPSDDALTRCLKDMLNCPAQAPIYIIVDALDECPNTYGRPSPRQKVLMLVEELVDLHIPDLHICVTSRLEIDIKTIIRPLATHSVSLHNQRGQMQDILDYVRSTVNWDLGMRKWTAEDKELVVDVLSQRADGMFQWVVCQFDVLRNYLPGRIQYALDELPGTVDGMYERILQDIPDTKWECAHLLLQCVLVAHRPLLVEELAEFLAFDSKAGPIPKFWAGWRLEDPEDALLSTCSGLLSVVEANGSRIVQFTHASVKEFLTSNRIAIRGNSISRYRLLMTPAHTIVAQGCLSALLRLADQVLVGPCPV